MTCFGPGCLLPGGSPAPSTGCHFQHRTGYNSQVDKGIELDVVGHQYEPYLTAGCICTAAPSGSDLKFSQPVNATVAGPGTTSLWQGSESRTGMVVVHKAAALKRRRI